MSSSVAVSAAASTTPVVRPVSDGDWPAIREIYAAGIRSGHATFETVVPPREALESKWLPGHTWVAEVDGVVAGWAALSPTSGRRCYAGVAETSVYVAESVRGRGVGGALVRHQAEAADAAGLWTLQAVIFPENTASVNLHRSVGYRLVGRREAIARLNGVWQDTLLLERKPATWPRS